MTSSHERLSQLTPLQQATVALKELRGKVDAFERREREPIAIIGVGCRFPGGADSPEAFWELLRVGGDAVVDIPPGRWDVDAYYDADPDVPGKMYARCGGFLDQVDQFDAQFFGIAPREALVMDPQQRLLLEVAWEALERAGVAPERLRASRTGVFVGIGTNDYAHRLLAAPDLGASTPYTGTGNALCFAAGRLSYVLGLQGPTVAVDTACSSSLVALHLACQSLRAHECEAALAAGVQLMLSPNGTVFLSQIRALAPDGRCKTFDASADGFSRGEGCGVVVLKRLSDAQRDGDRVLALIRGSAVNHDGPSSGLTVPNGRAQERLIRDALRSAGVAPSEVSYVEAHGTATRLGDPIEVEALAAVLGEGRDGACPVAIGSVKTNIGHLEAAAGVAGVLKVVLSLQHCFLPPHLHFREPNPQLDWAALPVTVPVALVPWEVRRRVAGVSSFGLSGTNAHVILEEAPSFDAPVAGDGRPLHLLALSARSSEALRALVGRYVAHFVEQVDQGLADVCSTALLGRAHFGCRLAAVADSCVHLRGLLEAFLAGREEAGLLVGEAVAPRRPRVAFLFSGQGTQFVGMGRELYATQPVFRAALDQCAELLLPMVGQDIRAVLYPVDLQGDEEDSVGGRQRPSALDRTGLAQPVLFAVEYALTQLWRFWGVVPDVVLGHSLGEYVAACVAGVFSLEDALRLVAERGRLMVGLPDGGVMVAVSLPFAEVEALLVSCGGGVGVAALNGPSETVISGLRASVEEIVALVVGRGVRVRWLPVSYAFHSPLVEPILGAFESVVGATSCARPGIALVSNVTGCLVDEEVCAPGYWCRHMREPVRFADGMRALDGFGVDLLIEIGPHPVLLGMGRRCLPDHGGLWLPSLRSGRGDWQQLLESLGQLYVGGFPVDWEAFARGGGGRRVVLPTYPFQRERFWIEPYGAFPTMALRGDQGEVAPAPVVRSEPGIQHYQLADQVRMTVAGVLGLGSDRLTHPQQGFFDMGMDSLMAVELRRRLERLFGRAFSPTLAFDYPTLAALTAYLQGELAAPVSPGASSQRRARYAPDEPIAVIGMGCRFPGEAHSPDAYWELLRAGVDAIGEVPPDRWDGDAFYDSVPQTVGKSYCRTGGFLRGVGVDQFDAQFFGISPREAQSMDPQQRLLLEVAWEALEHAGVAADRLGGSLTGVFMGIATGDFSQLSAGVSLASMDSYTGTGTSYNVAAGRLSYVLGLQGPNMPVDTACSSSLVAVHLACQSLREGESDLALAGGVNLMLAPYLFIYYSQMLAIAPDGRSKTFDAGANGFGRGEGCGVVVLKRLSDAQRDGDRVLALIRGSAVNHDGRSGGLTVPNGSAQQSVIRSALVRAGVEPHAIGYVEVHGTGTPLGDPIEAHALAAVLGAGRSGDQPLVVGSVKTNLGHLEAAAGIAGLMKVILSLQHAEIPPHLHFQSLNEQIAWGDLPVRIPTMLQAWPAGDEPRRAGISAFGISGTNAHVVVEEAPQVVAVPRLPIAEGRPYVLPLSARSPAALRVLAERYQQYVAERVGDDGVGLWDVCYTAGVRRSQLERRAVLVGRSCADLSALLAAFAQGREGAGLVLGGSPNVGGHDPVFVFSGHGSHWFGMGRGLLVGEPVFRAVIERCDALIRVYGGWSLLERFADDEVLVRFDDIAVVQPMVFAVQVGLAALWRAWGVEPCAVVGHSVGEVAAACVSGALTLEDGVRLVCLRSRLLARIAGMGSTAAVGLSLAEAQAEIGDYADRLAVAVSTSPHSTVISGDSQALQEVLVRLQARNVFCRPVRGVHVAAHSPQIDQLLPDLLIGLADIRPVSALVPFYSTVLARVCSGTELDAGYWARNLREPVLFWPAIERLAGDGYDTFIEQSPHPLLLTAIEQGFQKVGRPALVLASLQRDADEQQVLLESLGRLYCAGYPLDWGRLYPVGVLRADLPTYPWQRKRFWPDLSVQPAPVVLPVQGFSMLQRRFVSARPPQEYFWECDVDQRGPAYFWGLCVRSVGVLPDAAIVDMVLEGARACGFVSFALVGVEFSRLVVLPPDECCTLQLVVAPQGDGCASFQLFSALGGGAGLGGWRLAASGAIRPVSLGGRSFDGAGIQRRCREQVVDDYYRVCCDRGLELAVGLRTVERLWVGQGEVLVRFVAAGESQDGVQFPVVLEQVFHLFAGLVFGVDDLLLPMVLGSVQHHCPGATPLWCHVRLRDSVGDVDVFDGDGVLVASVCGLGLRSVRDELAVFARARRLRDWTYQVAWRVQERGVDGFSAGELGRWLILADGHGLGQALADELERRGCQVVLVFRGEGTEQIGPKVWVADPYDQAAFARLLERLIRPQEPPLVVALHLWGLDLPSFGECDQRQIQSFGPDSALLFAQVLLRVRGAQTPRLWFGTRGAQSVAGRSEVVAVEQAPLWGVGRVVALEHPEVWGGLIDLDPHAFSDEVQRLLVELSLPDGEDHVAFRGGRRLVARLVRGGPFEVSSTPLLLRADATYLITGGLGGAGLAVARWMVERGARRLILTGRSGLPDRAMWDGLAPDCPDRVRVQAIREMEACGVGVVIACVDVADAVGMERVFAGVGPDVPLRGIVHAAGSTAAEPIIAAQSVTLEAMLRPKVAGSMVLHRLVCRFAPDLDFFALFSSPAAIWGAAGLAAYAAANAFLDALAHYRRAMGQTALSVDWGAWDGGGMMLKLPPEARQFFAQIGLGLMDPDEAVVGLEDLIQADVTQQVYAPVDWARFKPVYEARRRRPLLDEIVVPKVEGDLLERGGLLRQIEQVPAEERWALLAAALQDEVSQVLGLDQGSLIEPDQGFFQIGMDSIMSVQLKTRLERLLAQALPTTLAFEYPSVAALVGYLGGELLHLVPPVPRVVSPPIAESLALDACSEDDLVALLAAELAEIDEEKLS